MAPCELSYHGAGTKSRGWESLAERTQLPVKSLSAPTSGGGPALPDHPPRLPVSATRLRQFCIILLKITGLNLCKEICLFIVSFLSVFAVLNKDVDLKES